MLVTKLCQVPLRSLVSSSLRSPLLYTKPQGSCLMVRVQNYASRGSRVTRKTTRSAINDAAAKPAGAGAITAGRGLVAGSCAVGLGALCYYGAGMSDQVGALEKSVLWAPEVKQRIRSTYMYFTASLGVTAASAVMVSRTPALMNIAMKNGWMALIGSMALMIGSGMVARSIPYKEGLGVKQLAWLAHSGAIGFVLAPMTLMGGPLLLRAAWYTAGVVGALSSVAACAPSEKFLHMGGPLAIGFGLVLASSIAGMFASPVSALGAGLASVSVYGGAVLFGLFILYDTQKIIHKAENHPTYGAVPFDPINASVGIFLDTINIFIRIAIMLASGKKK